MAKTIFFFTNNNSATLSQVGGKGQSLILSSQAGLPVPPGFILSVDFFAPWFQKLRKSSAWSDFLDSKQSDLKKSCSALKKQAKLLSFTPQQLHVLDEALGKYPTDTLFAVRSSSPEEDLEGASFAGGYETVLGVTSENLQPAIKQAFASCLDYRVSVYKRQNGFDVTDPKIAVIIQQQIASEVSGVGFSLNPLTNNYDEAVFNANWGLGETVVAGQVTPDTYTINKLSLKITNKTLGKKELAIYLTSTGGTETRQNNQHNSFTLSDHQVLELTKLVKQVENLYKKPIDMEWTYCKDQLYLLQARPITTYFPLPTDMITPPGKPKQLYLDFTISVQGIYDPISIAGTAFFTSVVRIVGQMFFFRNLTQDIKTTLPWVTPGRMYGNLSNLLKLMGKKKLVNFLNILDPLAAKTIQNINEQDYLSNTSKLKLLPIGLILKLPRLARLIFRARLHPEQTHLKLQQKFRQFQHQADNLVKQPIPLTILSNQLIKMLIDEVILNTVPLFIIGKIALKKMKQLAGTEFENKLAPLEVALANNVTTEMGLSLFQLARLLPANLNQTELLTKIRDQSLPSAFMSAWEKFITTYGHRGPLEIDLAAARYHDNPKLLLEILLSLSHSPQDENPQTKFIQNQAKSREVYELIYQAIRAKSHSRAKDFQTQYKIFSVFAGYRESHKFYLALVTDLLRQKILQTAESLYQAGRLQSIEQVFDLTLENLDQAVSDPTFNLIDKAIKNRKYINQLTHVSHIPTVIDSRGLILHPPAPPVHEGEVVGTPISAGIVEGRIKVLHTPDEKPLLRGEILVARATDPGWTPLFINASAIILEVGGILQHGALVAREYGLPCVAGIENATNIWSDGTLVEVDGTAGIVRLVTKKSEVK